MHLGKHTNSGKFYSFGIEQNGRNFSSSSFRYGFSGMEKDNEIKGNGNSYDFVNRIYDSRVAQFITIDQIAEKSPSTSPYCYAINSPILHVDVNGNYAEVVTTKYYRDKTGSLIKKSGFKDVFRRTAVIDKIIYVHNAKFYDGTNRATSKEEMDYAAKEIEKDILLGWNQEGKKNVNNPKSKEICVTVEFVGGIKVIDDLSKVNGKGEKSDHLFLAVDESIIENSYPLGMSKGVANLTLGHVVLLRPEDARIGKGFVKYNVAHEFGHMGNLQKCTSSFEEYDSNMMNNIFPGAPPTYSELEAIYKYGDQKKGYESLIKTMQKRISDHKESKEEKNQK